MAETPHDTEPVPPAIPQMQSMYQQGMLDPEVTLLYTRVGRISFDGTSDPLDFLHAIEMRTQIVRTEYHQILIVELSVERPVQHSAISV